MARYFISVSAPRSVSKAERAQKRASIRAPMVSILYRFVSGHHRVSSFFPFSSRPPPPRSPQSPQKNSPKLLLPLSSSLSSFSPLPPLQATVDDLRAAFAAAKPKYYPSRQRFTLPLQPGERKPAALAPGGKKLSEFGVRDGSELTFKDLGPQIGYSTVFFWEYFGPALVYALIYFFPKAVYPWAATAPSRWGGGSSGGIPAKTQVQKLALGYWTFHYAKRIFETFFVHR